MDKEKTVNILGIETACDDTSAAVVRDGHEILSNVIWDQQKVHEKYRGVVPELAARRHTEVITRVIEAALVQANMTYADIDAIGVNAMRGLLRSVVVGVAAAKVIAFARNIPIIGLHHIEGHIYSIIVDHPNIEFPFICLTVSGGHNMLIHVQGHGQYELLGMTLDDAAGEAFDKIAKLLNIGYPGGPIIDRLAKTGNPKAFSFPRPMLNRSTDDFSFSGLKTAVLTCVQQLKKEGSPLPIPDIVASFQQAVIDVLVKKTMNAAIRKGVSTIAVAGGVSANSLLRQTFDQNAARQDMHLYFPQMALCMDNAAMIAALAYYKLKKGETSGLNLDASANAPFGIENE
ncbi:MAG: tRNA (adenosine(37)-N6)-threonylcarbamoyltransferase complex transferase subunit TsaD [Candidatus Magnetomorum sp.]|nr:tRNA (adenosine(37)-N6)-threonylcarbamoyltransferase complex transferase subunit TsaD [Candidatus Magnetomorum sp.]